MVENSYDGTAQVGGPAAVRNVPGAEIRKLAVGPMDNNAYLVRCTTSGARLLIDAAAEPERLLAELADQPLAGIVTTHRHADHWQALDAVVRATGAPVSAHPLDAPELPVPVERPVEDGDQIVVGELRLRVIHLVGHTPGSIALHLDVGERDGRGHLFTGDSLFPGGPGNTFGDPAAFATLLDDLENKVFGPLPDATWVYPGHGADTTLGAERPHLGEWRARGW